MQSKQLPLSASRELNEKKKEKLIPKDDMSCQLLLILFLVYQGNLIDDIITLISY
jgi:hypothetical protein